MQKMQKRKAFTLIELLVVIGIITLLIGILLPMLLRVRRSAQVTQQKADFQTISSALEAYKSDFGDYPRNSLLPGWNTQNLPPNVNTTPWPAPVFLTLASALLGPGPGYTQITNSGSGAFEIGDGADGLGFRSSTVNIPVSVSALSLTGTSPTVTISAANPSYSAQLSAFFQTFVPGQTDSMLTLSAGTSYEETVGISSVIATSGQLTLAAQVVYNGSTPQHSQTDNYILKIATGKVWGPYVPADTFKIALLPTQDVNAQSLPNFEYGQPLLLDRWGQVIQYFPQYHQPSNRTNDSTMYSTVNTQVVVGPLYGFSQPKSTDNMNGEDAMIDRRDGAPFFNNLSSSNGGKIQQWLVTPAPSAFDPGQAIQWMLGDQTPASGGSEFNDVIIGSDKLSSSGPYILISSGPDGPYRANGGFCNFLNPTTGQLLPQNQWQSTFLASGNIYNFDHP